MHLPDALHLAARPQSLASVGRVSTPADPLSMERDLAPSLILLDHRASHSHGQMPLLQGKPADKQNVFLNTGLERHTLHQPCLAKGACLHLHSRRPRLVHPRTPCLRRPSVASAGPRTEAVGAELQTPRVQQERRVGSPPHGRFPSAPPRHRLNLFDKTGRAGSVSAFPCSRTSATLSLCGPARTPRNA